MRNASTRGLKNFFEKSFSFVAVTDCLMVSIISSVASPVNDNTRLAGAYIFGFFAFMMVLQLLYVWKMMPETKGVALEDMEKNIVLH